jgi:hypothetical protein
MPIGQVAHICMPGGVFLGGFEERGDGDAPTQSIRTAGAASARIPAVCEVGRTLPLRPKNRPAYCVT